MALPPPTYEPVASQPTQLLISPCPDAVQFQKGFLGAQGERAAIEGELHIKSAGNEWKTATVSLQTIELTPQQTIELSSSTLVLFSNETASSSLLPSSSAMASTLQFSIPLMPDTPQCIHTPHSSITHRLTATLHPHNHDAEPLTKSVLVHTRRYTSPNRPPLQIHPRTFRLEDPVPVKVEIPRTTFRIGEPIPVYITIPPPQPSVIASNGLMLRNVMAELVRVIRLASDSEPSYKSLDPSGSPAPIFPDEKEDPTLLSHSPNEVFSDDGLCTILTRSGSSCRFHTSRVVQIRLLLYPHQSALHAIDSDSRSSDQMEDDHSDCASITQSTLLHAVTFHLAVKTTFLHPRTHSESTNIVKIPITLSPNPAPLPEVDESVAAEYRKKHDKPPVRTVRHQDADILDNEAGPSVGPHNGAPPPFEEQDAPPPFSSDLRPSTSSRLPTFLESESDHIPFQFDEDASEIEEMDQGAFVTILGEGTEFGFSPSDQYDGISTSLDGTSTPPPTVANADLDTDVTEFANLTERGIENLGLALDQSATERDVRPHSDHTHTLPPPPPPLDDPSDPPPSIDVEEFSRPVRPLTREQSPPIPSLSPAVVQDISAQAIPQRTSMVNAPPPYLHPRVGDEPEETVTHPPPYVDVLPVGN